jgi:pimeloyl-ACP methyl ester carboxylesterase
MIVNGVDLHVIDEGSGVPIVFSHGLLWSGRMFEAQARALSSRHRCIRYDHRGQGKSASSPSPYDMEQLADDAATLIQNLKAAPCHFVGLSMGGFVGLRLALERPDLLRSLTLIESAGDAEPRLNVPKYKAMSLVAKLFGYRPLLPAVMRIMFGKTFLKDPARAAIRRQQEEQLLELDPLRVEPALGSVIWRRPLMDRLSRIRTPTQIVHGTEDRAIVPERAKRTCSAIPNARWVPIDRAGHTSTVEEPAAVTAALESFFATVAG